MGFRCEENQRLLSVSVTRYNILHSYSYFTGFNFHATAFRNSSLLSANTCTEDGRLFHFAEKDKSLKQFIEGKVSAYQQNNEGITRKLVLGTIDGSPKKDLQLQREAMPTPVAIRSGPLIIGDVTYDHPKHWHKKTPKHNSPEEFAEISEPVLLEDILTPKKELDSFTSRFPPFHLDCTQGAPLQNLNHN